MRVEGEMGHAYSPKNEKAGSPAPAAARLHVTATDPFKLKAEYDAARRTARAQDGRGSKKAKPKLAAPAHASAKGPALRVIASNETARTGRSPKPAKAPALTVVASASDASVVTDADFTELPKAPASEKPIRLIRKRGGGNGAGGPPTDRIFNQDDLAGVLIVLALLLLLGLFFVSSGSAPPPESQRLASAAAVESAAAPAPLVDPFGDKPVDLTPKSPPPPPVVEAVPAPAPVCPPGRMMRAWFCTAQSELTAASRAALEKDVMDWGPCLTGKQLVVTGYADTRGAAEYNVMLSHTRASVVADLLRAKGVKIAQVTGAGELSGLADNENCANQRRVDARLSDDPEAPPSRSCAPPDKFVAPSCE